MERDFGFIDGTIVSRIGFGAMRLTGQPGNFGPYTDWEGGVALLREAHDLGYRFFDTARAYASIPSASSARRCVGGRR